MSVASAFSGNSSQSSASALLLDDADLFIWLQRQKLAREPVLVAHAGHLFKVCQDRADSVLFTANPDVSSDSLLNELAKAKLLKHIELPLVELNGTATRSNTWTPLECSPKEIKAVLKARNATFGRGRGKQISDATKRAVWNASAGRCMYRGCSADLTSTPLVAGHTNIGYLAHIVASDPDGPRGDYQESHALSDDPENIMLMCDAHHRLIDRVDEAGHSTELLRAMRKERCDTLRNLLDDLSHPRAQAITLLADIANVATVASERDIRAAMHQQKTSPLPIISSPINRSNRDGRTAPGFWNHVLHEHENDFREVRRLFAGATSGNCAIKPERTAVFPLMTVPMLFLCGRMAGQASAVDLYQYDRDQATWQWNYAKAPQPQGTFLMELGHGTPTSEVLLSIELTASLDVSKLPQALQDGLQQKQIAWVRIVTPSPHYGCIARPEDLEQFSSVAAMVIRHINDVLRAQRVHLIGLSPASTLFRFGQMLQAGHHPDCVTYDRPDNATGFVPAILIAGDKAVAAAIDNPSNQTIIPLR